jgi:predicted Co/Zn/Cd cation transporter (cation efflux family)
MDAKLSVDVGANISSILAQLAAQIGVTADKVFPWYVKQQVISAGGTLAVHGLIMVLCLWAFFTAFRNPFMGDRNENPSNAGLVMIVAVVISAINLFILCFTFPDILAKLLNPEHAAVSQILRDLRAIVTK